MIMFGIFCHCLSNKILNTYTFLQIRLAKTIVWRITIVKPTDDKNINKKNKNKFTHKILNSLNVSYLWSLNDCFTRNYTEVVNELTLSEQMVLKFNGIYPCV